MPDPTFVPGYLGVVSIATQDISAIAHVTKLGRSRAGLAKKTFGNRYAYAIGGQREFSFSASGSVTAEQMAAIDTAYETDTPVAFSLQIGEAAGATDAGVYTGNCVLTTLDLDAGADGQWEFTLDAIGSDAPLYTPAV
jgi:hypothetical protein